MTQRRPLSLTQAHRVKTKLAGLSVLHTPIIDEETDLHTADHLPEKLPGRLSVCDSVKPRLPCAKSQLLYRVTFIFYQLHRTCQEAVSQWLTVTSREHEKVTS